MHQTPDHYALYLQDGGVMPSPLLAYLPATAPRPSLLALRDQIAREAGVHSLSDVAPPQDGNLGSLRFASGEGDACLEFELTLEASDSAHGPEAFAGVPQEDAQLATESSWCIYLGTYLGNDVLNNFHDQLKMLHFVAPDAVLVYDFASMRPHTGRWIRDAALSAFPPPAQTLYSIHVVTDPNGHTEWLHSHGLHRCGSIELEMLTTDCGQASTYRSLFDAVAALMIEYGPPLPGLPFEAGQGIELLWSPWEDAVLDLPPGSPGGKPDRDEFHQGPSGVLFTVHRHDRTGDVSPKPLAAIRPILDAQPTLFLTDMETRRMSQLSKHRFPEFRSLHARFKDRDGWFFQVKMGYQIDDCPDHMDENEHLWFHVCQIRNGQVTATLLNEPCHIARMHAGDTNPHALDQLSDWSIDTPYGSFDANTIGRLVELVGGT